jgi:hypothetical protein
LFSPNLRGRTSYSTNLPFPIPLFQYTTIFYHSLGLKLVIVTPRSTHLRAVRRLRAWLPCPQKRRIDYPFAREEHEARSPF